MIDPKSLRIGNKLFNDKKEVITVRGIEMPDGYVYEEGYDRPLYEGQYHPIPLSEQELIRLGWESIGELHPTFKLWNYLLEEDMLRTGKYYLRQIINKEDSLCISGEILYVHELQNIFRDLKRKELEYKVETETIKP